MRGKSARKCRKPPISPKKSTLERSPLPQGGRGRDAHVPVMSHRCTWARRPRSRHAGETPAPPGGAGVMGCIAVCGLEARVSRRCRGDGSYRCMRAGSPRTRHAGATLVHPGGDVLWGDRFRLWWKRCDARVLRGDVRSCDPAHHIQQRAGRPVTSQRTFRAFFVGVWSVIGAIATRCIVWQIVVVHGAESSL
jgi:hypothetical protein